MAHDAPNASPLTPSGAKRAPVEVPAELNRYTAPVSTIAPLSAKVAPTAMPP